MYWGIWSFMVNLITTKITNLPADISPVYTAAREEKELSSDKQASKIGKPVSKKIKNAAVSLGLVTSGLALVYYGVTRPGKVAQYKELINDRAFQIEKHLLSFSNTAKNLAKNSFNDSEEYIKQFSQTRNFHPEKYTDEIYFAKDLGSVLKHQDKVFKLLGTEFNGYLSYGASDFEKFESVLHPKLTEVRGILDNERAAKNVACGDLIIVPPLEEAKYSELCEASEGRLVALASSASENMINIENKILTEVKHKQSVDMATAIVQARNSVTEGKRAVIDVAFEKFRRVLGLPKTFEPSYAKDITKDNFNKLPAEALKPQQMPRELSSLFKGNACWDAVKKSDFSKISEKDISKIFEKTTPVDNISDIKIMIDRLRLRREYFKSLGKSELLKSHNTAIAKLEYLYTRLKKYGESELIKICNEDFENISIEQRKVKVGRLSLISRRLGFNSLEQTDSYYSQISKTYNQSPAKEYMSIIKDYPDLYFKDNFDGK